MMTLAPLVLAPNASALPAPPAPTTTNCFAVIGDGNEASPLTHPRTGRFREVLLLICHEELGKKLEQVAKDDGSFFYI